MAEASKLVAGGAKAKPPAAGKGRKKGVPNKATAALKDAILNAFSQVGGEAYLVTVAKTDPKTFCTLLGKVLPLQVTGADDGPVKLVVEWQRPE
jgi:hypothetical protein